MGEEPLWHQVALAVRLRRTQTDWRTQNRGETWANKALEAS